MLSALIAPPQSLGSGAVAFPLTPKLHAQHRAKVQLMSYNSFLFANAVLERSFADNVCLQPAKLQRICYFTASEYGKLTSEPLFLEPFVTGRFGPLVYSIFEYFNLIDSRAPITHYIAPRRASQFFMLDVQQDGALQWALNYVYRAVLPLGTKELMSISMSENSAWDKAFQNDQAHLDWDDVIADRTYEAALGIRQF